MQEADGSDPAGSPVAAVDTQHVGRKKNAGGAQVGAACSAAAAASGQQVQQTGTEVALKLLTQQLL